MEHEVFFVFTGHGIDDLTIAGSTEGSHYQGLGFTAGKQGRAMGTR